MFLLQKTPGMDHADIDVHAICPDRPLPAWVSDLANDDQKRRRPHHDGRRPHSDVDTTAMRHDNIPRHYYDDRTHDHDHNDDKYAPEPVRLWPGVLRELRVPSDSGVAEYVRAQPGFSKRKKFAPPRGRPDF